MEFSSSFVLFSCLVAYGSSQDYSSCWYTHSEKAYTGAYEIDYPRDCRSQHNPHCWLIRAYRKGYVIHLKFRDVNITQNERTSACTEQIVVHDGKDVGDTVLDSFCGLRDPEIITTQRHALIVFNSNSTHGSKGRFKVKYRAIKKRAVDVDSFALSFAFGGTIGAIALLVICSGVFRRYKLAQRGRTGFFLFRRPRVNDGTSNGRGGESASGRNGQNNRIGQTAGNSQTEQVSFKNRILTFIQGILNMKSEGNVEETRSSTSDSEESSRRRRRGRDRQTNASSGPRRGHINSSLSNRYPEFSSTTCSDATDSSISHTGHEAFGYQDIPVSSFTSDPDAVRPPTYEDSVNRANPLYLCQYGNVAHYNRAFDMKDENNYMYSPPPPYTEINHNNVVEEQPISQLRVPGQEVARRPMESAPPEETSTLERSADAESTVASSPEDHKSIDQEIDLCNKDSDAEKIVECFEKSDTGLEGHHSDGDGLGVGNEESIKLAETLALIEESDETSKPAEHISDRDGELQVEGILVKNTATGSGPQGTGTLTNKGEKANRQTVTIPLDMMRRSGLKTSKSVSPTHVGVTPVEECGAVGYTVPQNSFTEERAVANVGVPDQIDQTTDSIRSSSVDQPTDVEHESYSQNRNNEEETGVTITKSGEIEL